MTEKKTDHRQRPLISRTAGVHSCTVIVYVSVVRNLVHLDIICRTNIAYNNGGKTAK